MSWLASAIIAVATVTPAAADDTVPKRWRAGVEVGLAVPRTQLDPGILVGAVGTFGLDADGTWLAHASVDWVHTGRQANALVSPSPFPRSRTDVDERTDLVTIAAGGSVRLAKLTAFEVRAGLSAGLLLARAQFDAYSMSQVERSIGPAATLEVSVGVRTGATSWRAVIAWREARRDLGTASAYGDEASSGLIVMVRADW